MKKKSSMKIYRFHLDYLDFGKREIPLSLGVGNIFKYFLLEAKKEISLIY